MLVKLKRILSLLQKKTPYLHFLQTKVRNNQNICRPYHIIIICISAMNMTALSAIGLLKHVEINLLRKQVANLNQKERILKDYYTKEINSLKEESVKKIEDINIKKENVALSTDCKRAPEEIKRQASLNKEMHDIEKINHKHTKNAAKNSDIVLKLLMEAFTTMEQEVLILKNMNEKQAALIKFKEQENLNHMKKIESLTRTISTMEDLVRKEETSKRRIQRVLKMEREISQNYAAISKLDLETPDYLSFVAEMTKSLMDQHTLIEDLK